MNVRRDRGTAWVKPCARTDAEISIPLLGAFIGGALIGISVLNRIPPEATNSVFVVGFFLQCFAGLWLLMLPTDRKARPVGLDHPR